ncbi:putative EG45-like domain containing protein, plant [Dioscorea sansibarensis]
MIAAGSHEIFDDGRACGHLLKVKCIGGMNNGVAHPCRGSGTVVVKLVDLCPSGCQGTIDLSQEAFAKIADPDAGKIEVVSAEFGFKRRRWLLLLVCYF